MVLKLRQVHWFLPAAQQRSDNYVVALTQGQFKMSEIRV